MKRKYYYSRDRNVLIFQHIYQRSKDRSVVFKTVKDHLVLYTIYNVYARKNNVTTLAMCHMSNHFHYLSAFPRQKMIEDFMKKITAVFSVLYNNYHKRCGKLWKRPFGSAFKPKAQNICNTVAYIFNNPVAKNLCKKAIDYKWNYLKLLETQYYNERILVKRNYPMFMREEFKLIDEKYELYEYLDYEYLTAMQDRIVEKVGKMKKFKVGESKTSQQMNNERYKLINNEIKKYLTSITDYILFKYNSVDLKRLISFYGDFKTLELAINSNTGNEHDIPEDD